MELLKLDLNTYSPGDDADVTFLYKLSAAT